MLVTRRVYALTNEVTKDVFVLLVICMFRTVLSQTGSISYGNYALGASNSYTGYNGGGAGSYTDGGGGGSNVGGSTGDGGGGEKTCHTTDASPYRLYGSKTKYEDVRMAVRVEEANIPGCQPRFFYLLARHGNRSPTSGQMKDYKTTVTEIQKLVSLSQGTMCGSDYMRIKAWQMQFNEQAARNRLTRPGYDTLYNLGVRYKARYPTLLKQPFNPGQVHIQHTYYNKTRDSAAAFAYAVYNRRGIQMHYLDGKSDKLLRYYSRCKKYVKTAHTVREYKLFMDGPTIKQTELNVNRRLGLPNNYLTSDSLDMLWDLCRYEHTMFSRSPWCAAFSKTDIQVMEYAGDLRDSHRSYALPISTDMTCALMKDIISRLRTGYSSGQLAALRFTHAITLQTIFARLGLFRDAIPLMSNNMASQSGRKWRTSRSSPFGGHIAFVLYTCDNSGSSRLRVRVLVNEAPIVLPSCSSDLCDIDTVFGVLSAWSARCSYDRICAGNETGPVTSGQNTGPVPAITKPSPQNDISPVGSRPPITQAPPRSVGVPSYPPVSVPTDNAPSQGLPAATIRTFDTNGNQYGNSRMMCPNTILIYVSSEGIQTVIGMEGMSSPASSMLNSGVQTKKVTSPLTLSSNPGVDTGSSSDRGSSVGTGGNSPPLTLSVISSDSSSGMKKRLLEITSLVIVCRLAVIVMSF